MRRRSLSDMLRADIARDPGGGPDWVQGVVVACAVQDMEWALAAVNQAPELVDAQQQDQAE